MVVVVGGLGSIPARSSPRSDRLIKALLHRASAPSSRRGLRSASSRWCCRVRRDGGGAGRAAATGCSAARRARRRRRRCPSSAPLVRRPGRRAALAACGAAGGRWPRCRCWAGDYAAGARHRRSLIARRCSPPACTSSWARAA
ncbi:MAG: hypothetical protein MZW92_40085 [Comamonadaceae bacterium]|nr:hypothetical protein [Comamonadaceae bacterium]